MSTSTDSLLECCFPIIEKYEDCLETLTFQMNDIKTLTFLWGFGEVQPLNHFEFDSDCDNDNDINQLASLLVNDLNVGQFDYLPVHGTGWNVIRPISSVNEGFWVRKVHPDANFLSAQSSGGAYVLRCCDSHALCLFLDTESGLWSITTIIPDLI